MTADTSPGTRAHKPHHLLPAVWLWPRTGDERHPQRVQVIDPVCVVPA